MRILLDQGTPAPLREYFPDDSIRTAYERGWSMLRNGELLDNAETEFDLLITTDRNLRNLSSGNPYKPCRRRFGGATRCYRSVTLGSWPFPRRHPLRRPRRSRPGARARISRGRRSRRSSCARGSCSWARPSAHVRMRSDSDADLPVVMRHRGVSARFAGSSTRMPRWQGSSGLLSRTCRSRSSWRKVGQTGLRGRSLTPALVREIHELLYAKLPEADRVTDEGQRIVPGKYREDEVQAGQHAAPPRKDVEELMESWAGRYRTLAGTEAVLIGIACSHHRLTWIHPFIDGNGRAARLHSCVVLDAMGLTHGLWSPMRGMARAPDRYYARLHNADLPRRNDLDGRGVLSQEELVEFARYFLEICLDQVRFMSQRLDLTTLKDRIKTLLMDLEGKSWQVGSEKSIVKLEALEALHYVAMAGPLERSRFVAMTGLGERTGRRVMASLLDFGVLAADTPRAPLRFAVPLESLRFLFPNLWPEAETD